MFSLVPKVCTLLRVLPYEAARVSTQSGEVR